MTIFVLISNFLSEGFDSHLLLSNYSELDLEEEEEHKKFKVIPTNSQVKYFMYIV